MIKYQDRTKFKDIENIFISMMTDVKSKNFNNRTLHKKYSKDLTKSMLKAFGIKLDLKIQDDNSPAYCYPSYINYSNPLLNTAVRYRIKSGDDSELSDKKYREEMKKLKGDPGKVDLSKAKIGGGYSKIASLMVLDVVYFSKNNYTGPMMLSVFFHELGHIFTFFENAMSIRSRNSFLEDATMAMLEKEEKDFKVEEVTAKIIGIGKKHDVEKEIVEALASNDQKNRSVYLMNAVRIMGNVAKSDSNSIKQDSIEAERLADMFAVRLGYEVELSKALAILITDATLKDLKRDSTHVKAQEQNIISKFLGFIWSIIKLVAGMTLMFILIGLLIAIMSMSLIVALIYHSIASILKVVGINISGNVNWKQYDDPIERLTNIKKSLIPALKDPKLSKEERKALVTKVDDLDYVIKIASTKLHKGGSFTGVLSAITDFINYGFAKDNLETDLYKYFTELENMANNDLFIESSRLNIMAQ